MKDGVYYLAALDKIVIFEFLEDNGIYTIFDYDSGEGKMWSCGKISKMRKNFIYLGEL